MNVIAYAFLATRVRPVGISGTRAVVIVKLAALISLYPAAFTDLTLKRY